MSVAVILLFIAGGAVLTALLAAGVDLAKRQASAGTEEAVLFEARSSLPLWITLLVGALYGLIAFFSSSLMIVLLPVAFGMSWPYTGRSILRITEGRLDHLPFAVASGGVPSTAFGAGPVFFSIVGTDVAGIAWDGFDNLGIRLRDGSIAPVNIRFAMRREDQEPARRAILAFVERAIGKPLPPPPEALPDVAPWMVRKPSHPSA